MYTKLFNFISGAQESLDDKIILKPYDDEKLKISEIQTPQDYLATANSTEKMEHIDICIHIWIKQIEQVCKV